MPLFNNIFAVRAPSLSVAIREEDDCFLKQIEVRGKGLELFAHLFLFTDFGSRSIGQSPQVSVPWLAEGVAAALGQAVEGMEAADAQSLGASTPRSAAGSQIRGSQAGIFTLTSESVLQNYSQPASVI